MKRLFLIALLLIITFVSFSSDRKPPRKAKKYNLSRSLVFPVAGKRSDIEGFWGDRRDGGRRSHKGIDIYANKGTPVVAVSDGKIVNRDNTVHGGKTLWLKPKNQAWTAYYAHLDKQLVKSGQWVRKGQVIGTVGNTGNARKKPSHLHFGIEGRSGWVNPLPYVKQAPKQAVKKAGKAKKAERVKKTRPKKRR